MPVRKDRSVEEMPDATCRKPLDPDNLRIAFELSAAAVHLSPRRFSPGVHRYRSVIEAWERRESWECAAPTLRTRLPRATR
jgi:hypothetical protein